MKEFLMEHIAPHISAFSSCRLPIRQEKAEIN